MQLKLQPPSLKLRAVVARRLVSRIRTRGIFRECRRDTRSTTSPGLNIVRVIIILLNNCAGSQFPDSSQTAGGELAKVNAFCYEIRKKKKKTCHRNGYAITRPLFIRKAETRDEFKFTTCETLLNIHNSSTTTPLSYVLRPRNGRVRV